MIKILLVDDDVQSLDSTRRILEFAGYEVLTAADGQEALDCVRAHRREVDLVVSDVRMPRMTGMEFLKALKVNVPSVPVVLMTAFGRVEDAVWAMKWGAVDFLSKPFRRDALLDAVQSALSRVHSGSAESQDRLVGESEAMKDLRMMIDQVANSDATTLVLGESGVGKELVARSIHEKSPRSKAPFVAVNCAAIPETLMESELFGYERGAFSGALHAKRGLFEEAQKGVLLLDEIGDMPLGLQAKLLRILQDGEVRRLGSNEIRRFEGRVIASTHQDLRALVSAGLFREDLLFRLDVIQVNVPPLRERRSDVELLAVSYLSRLNEKHSKSIRTIAPPALKVLREYAWPGNVRELINVIERAVVLCKTTEIQECDLPDHLLRARFHSEKLEPKVLGDHIAVPLGSKLKDVEQLLIEKTLEATDGDKSMTAKLLGVNSRTIYRKLEKRGE